MRKHKRTNTGALACCTLNIENEKVQLQHKDVEQQGDSLKALSLNGHVPQIQLQSLAELSQLLLGNHHLLTDQQQRL